jgi:hypothetical protein
MLPEARTVRDRLVAPPESDETKFEAQLEAMHAHARRREILAGLFAAALLIGAATLVVFIAICNLGLDYAR